MNDQPQSPPKRITRARAAAKTSDAGIRATKVATASTKAKLTRSTSTSTAPKRKPRIDAEQADGEEDDMDELNEPQPPRTTRARPKKAVVSTEPKKEDDAAPGAAKPARGRPKKAMAGEPATEPTRSTRGRPKKVEVPSQEAAVIQEPSNRIVRTRAATVTKVAAPKKTVKFEEPDKENIVPAAASAKVKSSTSSAATGLRANPIRKSAAAAPRTTRGRTKGREGEAEKPPPLSPKKATQIATAKENHSDDELSMDVKTPMKPLMKSPVKPPGSIFGTSKKLDFSNPTSAHTATASTTQDLGESIMGSPARRLPVSHFKDILKSSPQKTTLGDGAMPSLPAPSMSTNPVFKGSLLQSPARRPQSPAKVTEAGSPTRSGNSNNLPAATPKANTFKMSRFATPRTIAKRVIHSNQMGPPPDQPQADRETAMTDQPTLKPRSQSKMEFSGRLSSIIPRAVDPAFAASEPTAESSGKGHDAELELGGESIVIDHTEATLAVEYPTATRQVSSPTAPSCYSGSAFGLRVENNTLQDSDSEDELTSKSSTYSSHGLQAFRIPSPNFTSLPSTPTPFATVLNTPRAANTQTTSEGSQSCGVEKLGFTPLAQQLNDWMAGTPNMLATSSSNAEVNSPSFETTPVQSTQARPAPVSSPPKDTFFDDAMSTREEPPSDEVVVASSADLSEQDVGEIDLNSVSPDEEDIALANEAEELSLLEPDAIEVIPKTNHDENNIEPALSEASQEYGDENDIPIDPALIALPLPHVPSPPSFTTPRRIFSERACHTVSKIPLKPAAEDDSIRPSPKRRSLSISRLPVKRPSSTLQRNNTVISYSPSNRRPQTPTKSSHQEGVTENTSLTQENNDAALWSTLGTPPRTPRRDVNMSLLSGAIVFIDVHTTEGADASLLFNELLTQMGARCVKTWTWNGSEEGGAKVGITHIVFKDGGRRTLERAREAGSVVSCVGVGWVLDCERENKWLDEAPYAVDTSLVPRGGHRRRKSMEPRTLANLNGTLIPSSSITPARNSNSSPTKQSTYLPETPFASKSRRRESVQWVRCSPEFSLDDDKEADDETLLLSPVPVTPAPEAISGYAEHGLYGDETPAAQTPYFLNKEQLVQKTVPPSKGRFFEAKDEDEAGMGQGFLSTKKDENVMMRLMAARRKSLQWAPKVGSPLARGAAW